MKKQIEITTRINTNDASVEYVGTTDSFAWIKFSNGLQIDLSRSALEGIVKAYNKEREIEAYMASILSINK